jgi:tetratricopeptide (TPR) repeat protein
MVFGDILMIRFVKSKWVFFCVLGLFILGGCSSVGQYIERAEKLSEAELYEEAEAEYKKAAKLDPDNPKIKIGLKKVHQALAKIEVREALAYIEEGDHHSAIALLNKANKRSPKDRGLANELQVAAAKLQELGQKAVEQKKFQDALEILNAVITIVPNNSVARQRREEVEKEWAQFLYEKAETYLEGRLYGNALISLVKLGTMVGTYRDSASVEYDLRARLKQQAQFGVSVRPVKVKKSLRNLNKQIAENIRKQVASACPNAKPASKKNVKAIFKIEYLGSKIEQLRKVEQGTKKYQSGIRKVDNPEYLKLEESIADGRQRITELSGVLEEDAQRIEELRRVFQDAGPSDDEEAIRKRLLQAEEQQTKHQKELHQTSDNVVNWRESLSETPRKLDEPVYDDYRYDIVTVTKTATIKVQLDATIDGDDFLVDREYEGKASVKDSSNAAVPKYGVKADVLKFAKSDDELSKDALIEMIGQLKNVLEQSCNTWRQRILSRARQASAGAPIEATEDYVLYLFVADDELPKDLIEFMNEHHQIKDLAAIRSE